MLYQHLLNQFTSAFDFNLARIKCLTLLVSALLQHRTVNLTVLSTENITGAKNESCYRRFQNFFSKSRLPASAIGGFMLGKIPKPSTGWVLSMDRTNWKYGKRHINILTIGVIINKIAIPVAWKVLPQKTKRGNSNSKQRIAIAKNLLRLIAPKDIHVLTMDREFGGHKWLKWLDKNGIGYVVRVKSNTLVAGTHAKKHKKKRGAMAMIRHDVYSLNLFFAHKRIQSKGRRDSDLYLVSNRFSGKEALKLYKMRWGIEQLFSHIKIRGFNLEDTHMTNDAKLEKLFAIVSLAFLFSFGWGCELRSSGSAPKAVKRKSIFRQGLENILRLLSSPSTQEGDLDEFIRWLKPPIYSSIFVV